MQPQTGRPSGKVWDNTATWWLLRGARQETVPHCTTSLLSWALGQGERPTTVAGEGYGHAGAFNQNGQHRRRAA